MPDPVEEFLRAAGVKDAPVAADDPVEDFLRSAGATRAVDTRKEVEAVRSAIYGEITPESMAKVKDEAKVDEETIDTLLELQGHKSRVDADIAKWKDELDYGSFPGIFKKAPSEQALAFAKMGESAFRKAEREDAIRSMGGVPTVKQAREIIKQHADASALAEDVASARKDEIPWYVRYGARAAVGAREQLENAGAYVREKIIRPFYPEAANAFTDLASEYGMTEEAKAAVRKDTEGVGGALAEMAGATASFVPQVALGGIPTAAAISTAAAGGDVMAGVETATFLKMAGGLTKLFGGTSESTIRQVLAESGSMTASGLATRLGFHGDPGTLQQAGVDALSGLAFGVMGGGARARESAARFKSALEMGKTIDAAAKESGIPAERLKVPIPPEPMPGVRDAMMESLREPSAPPPDPVATAKEVRAQFEGREAPKPAAPEKPPVVEPPRVSEEAPRATPSSGMSVKNESVTASREARGLEPIERGPAQTFESWNAQAADVLKANPNKPQELIDEFSRKPRAHTPVETAVMTRHLVDLENARNAADTEVIRASDRGDADAVVEAKARSAAISDQYMTAAEVATTGAGSEAGRQLVARKMMLAENYSLLAMETRRRVVNDGKPLTEKQAAETKAMSEKLTRLRDELESHRARVGPSRQLIVRDSNYGRRNTIVTVEAYEQTRQVLREKLSRMSAGIDPTILADLAKIGAFHVEAGLRNFAEWSRAMIDDLGSKVGPHLRDVWKAAQEEIGIPLQKAKGSLETSVKEGRKPTENQAAIQKIAEHFVRSGVTDRSELIGKVHETLQEFAPGITYRETMDAISGYGVFKALNNDPAKVRLRELKAEMQQVAKLEDMAAGQAPLKTGLERQPLTDEARSLVKEVNEAKRRGGYDVRDPVTQLRSALDATKTRLTHQIADLERQIETRTKESKGRTPIALDAEATELRQRRDELKKQFDAVFGKPELTDAQRLKILKGSLTRRISDLEKRTEAGDFSKKERRPPVARDQEAIRLEAQLDTAKKRWEAALVRDAWNNKTTLEKAGAIAITGAHNLSRALMTMWDVSAVFRQGAILTAGHPRRAMRQLVPMLKAFASKEYQARSEAEIRLDPDYSQARRDKLFLSEHGDAPVGRMEETLLGSLAEKIPGLAGSQRAFTTFLNRLRFDVYKAGLKNLTDGRVATPKEGAAWANFINVATGRGGPPDSRTLNVLSDVFFSPRLAISRFQILLGTPMWKGSSASRVMIAKEYARALAGLSVFYGLAKLANGDIEKDGKVRWGKSVLDPLAGLSQAWVLINRIVPPFVSSVLGKPPPPAKFGESTGATAIGRFMRQKLAPLPGAAVNLIDRKDLVGAPVTMGGEALKLVTPMSFRDIYAAMKEHGVPKGAALGILSLFGMNLQHYEKHGR